jgi:hypothetical protein
VVRFCDLSKRLGSAHTLSPNRPEFQAVALGDEDDDSWLDAPSMAEHLADSDEAAESTIIQHTSRIFTDFLSDAPAPESPNPSAKTKGGQLAPSVHRKTKASDVNWG